jgi:DNA-binding protein Fis
MSNGPKELLIATIREWVEINSKLNEVMRTVKEFRNQKKVLTDSLVAIMKNNEIDCFDINNGKIVCRTTKTRAPINRQNLAKALEQYFADSPDIDVGEVSNYILESRQVKETSSLVIKQAK